MLQKLASSKKLIVLKVLFVFFKQMAPLLIWTFGQPQPLTCGQSYKAPTIVIYDSRGVPDLKLPHITTLES